MFQDELTAQLWTLGKLELIEVCQHLKCREPGGEGILGQPYRALIQLTENTLDEIKESKES